MKTRLLGLALLGIAVGGLVSLLTGGTSLAALLLALLAVPSAAVGLPLLVFGERFFSTRAEPRPRGRAPRQGPS